MKTVPLRGKKAAGRVARVDDGDYDLVMQHKWHIHDPEPKPGRRRKGPYAVTNDYSTGRHRVIRMHCLIMGAKYIDHEDHNGLNNQRSNLRVATGSQNNQNARKRLEATSIYKGVCRVQRGLWRAYIGWGGQSHHIADFASELEAAYAYDEAARERFGEFACPNFPEGPTQAMRDQWQAETEAREAAFAARVVRQRAEAASERWRQREPETCICVECGAEYQSRAVGRKMYCGKECRMKVNARGRRQRRAEKQSRAETATRQGDGY